MLPQLNTSRTILKSLQATDAASILRLRSQTKVMRYMDSDWCRNLNEAEMFICRQNEANKEGNGAVWGIFLKEEQTLIGHAGFWRINKEHFRAELGYALQPQYWRKGLMKEVLTRIIHFGFNHLQIHSVEANVHPDNQASGFLLTKLGFQLEARFRENYFFDGKFNDTLIYSLLQKDLESNFNSA